MAIDLHPDFVNAILLCLPVKSVLRFRALSISVCANIDGENFVKNHLRRLIGRKTGQERLLLTAKTETPTAFYASNVDVDDGLRLGSQLKNPFPCQDIVTQVCGSCYGLILLGICITRGSDYNTITEFALWNPSTRRYSIVPPAPVMGYDRFSANGLGFDLLNNNFKIVTISQTRDLRFPVCVYNLNLNSWNVIQDAPISDEESNLFAGDIIATGTFINGCVYWPRSNIHGIIGFNIASEVFFSIEQLPESCICGRLVFAGLDENVYSSTLRDGSVVQTFYIREMDSWLERFEVYEENPIDYGEDPSKPLLFSKYKNNVLISKDREIFWYNFDKKSRKRVKIEEIPKHRSFFYNIYRESLASLGENSACDKDAKEVIVNYEAGFIHR